MSNSNLVHIKAIEDSFRDSLRELLLIEAKNALQAGVQEDLSDIILELQGKELMALRRAFE